MKTKTLTVAFLLFLSLTLSVSAKAQSNEKANKSGEQTEKKSDEKVAQDRPFKIIKNSYPRNIYGRCEDDILVRLRVTFHSSAKVTDVEIVSPSGCDYFDREAVEAAQKIKFQPAIKDGEAQTAVKVIEYTFRRR